MTGILPSAGPREHYNRANRRRRTDGPQFRVWPPFATGLPWLGGFGLEKASGIEIGFGLAGALTGWVLIAGFLVCNGWSLWLFARHKTGLLPGQQTARLLSDGPYRMSRNPLYLGLLAAYLGAGLITSSWGTLALAPVAWLALQWGAVLPEERYLRSRLGEVYAEYCARVPRWL